MAVSREVGNKVLGFMVAEDSLLPSIPRHIFFDMYPCVDARLWKLLGYINTVK